MGASDTSQSLTTSMSLPAERIYLLSSFAWGVLFYMMVTVSMIYQVEMAGLNALELVLVGTALEVSAFLSRCQLASLRIHIRVACQWWWDTSSSVCHLS
jgi:hypothetical protein